MPVEQKSKTSLAFNSWQTFQITFGYYQFLRSFLLGESRISG